SLPLPRRWGALWRWLLRWLVQLRRRRLLRRRLVFLRWGLFELGRCLVFLRRVLFELGWLGGKRRARRAGELHRLPSGSARSHGPRLAAQLRAALRALAEPVMRVRPHRSRGR